MVSSGMGSIAVTTDPDRMESTLVSLGYPSSKTALNMITSQYAKALPGFRVNAADPGYTATDLNGRTGYQTVEEGSDSFVASRAPTRAHRRDAPFVVAPPYALIWSAIVELATVAPDGPTGGFFDRTGPVPW